MKVKTQSKKVNKAWLNDHVNDPYVKLAQKEGYRARAAFKLKEIDEQFKLIRPGYTVVDLGSAPGAWSQYARRKLSPEGAAVGALNGRIIALDLLPMDPVEGVEFIQGDFALTAVLNVLLQKLELPMQEARELAADLAVKTAPAKAAAKTVAKTPAGSPALATGAAPASSRARKIDVVISDMAPNLSGIASSDSARITQLVELAADFAQSYLKPEGALVVKLFHGSGYSQLVKLFKDQFRVVKPIKPKASRDKSSETFLLGMGLKTW